MKRKTLLQTILVAAITPALLAAASTYEEPALGEASTKSQTFEGKWSCEASKAEDLPGDQGKLVMSQKDNMIYKDKAHVESTGKMSVKVQKINAEWTSQMSGAWRVDAGKLCLTVKTVKITAANEDARNFEKQIGRPMQDAIPLGQENCEEIVEHTAKAYVTKDAMAGVLTRCTRN